MKIFLFQRTGPTRIPIFGSRIPVPGQQPDDSVRIPYIPKDTIKSPIGPHDLGRKVRVAEKDGLLRFVGDVHFASGVWCGVELFESAGKNDGSVRGVRYFQCPASHGLMAPLAKVSLVHDEGYEDCGSGPYSILFGLDKLPLANSTLLGKDLEDSPELSQNQCDSVVICDKKDQVGDTTQILNQSDVEVEQNETFKCRGRRNTFTYNNTSELNKTVNIEEQQKTFISTDKSLEEDKTLTNPSEASKLNVTISKTFTKNNQHNSTFTQSDLKRTTLLQNTYNINKTYQIEQQDNNSSRYVDRTSLPKNFNETFEKPSALRPLEFVSPAIASLTYNKFSHSTPRAEVEGSPSRKQNQNVYNIGLEDETNKRDSLELEESLGILTPEQMIDATNFPSYVYSRTPSSENIRSLPHDSRAPEKSLELPSPNLIDASLKDFSLGIIDENLISNLRSDTTTNMELPLDSVDKSKDFTITRLDQTPSPEELPLDPTPIAETESKTDTSKSKTTNSFIASIASITSLDTGYQGDGEMSRPASRGADNSPMTRRPLPRPQPRRPDPMTDSDFYTESDADNHEDHPLRGDRRAQVIDGTLYGVDPQAAADIYVNNRENMDSSGVFTDIESNTRADEVSSADANEEQRKTEAPDVSPSDSSTKTLSDNSQNNITPLITNKSPPKLEESKEATQKQGDLGSAPSKRGSPTPSSSPTNTRSSRHVVKEDPVSKKYKMPKRNVASKVKAMMEPSAQKGNATAAPKAKSAGRWDAVMNKISKTSPDESKNKLKDVKSKVFSGSPGQKTSDVRKVSSRQTVSSQKTASLKP